MHRAQHCYEPIARFFGNRRLGADSVRGARLGARDAHLSQLAGARIAPRREIALEGHSDVRQPLPREVCLERA